jgi:hypothetical protein
LQDPRQCVLTQEINPSVFWFIPERWNDTASHNNATGNLEEACTYLTGIDFLDDIHSATELGKTHQVWNMICVNKVICDLLMEGRCAFKFLLRREMDNDTFEVFLRFFWMPELPGRFNQPMDIDNLIKREYSTMPGNERPDLIDQLESFSKSLCPPTEYCQEKLSATSFSSLSSGHEVRIRMSRHESRLCESVVKIHWACVTFTALCGGAGRAWYLTGNNQANGRLEARDEQFREDEKKREK